MEALFALMQLVAELKLVRRDGWNALGRSVPGAESDADHSYGVGMMGAFVPYLLLPHLQLNIHRLTMMCLVHDLVEAKVGDINLFRVPPGPERDRLKILKKRKELRAMKKIRDHLGSPGIGEEIYDLWMEFEAGWSPEAKVAHELDKMEPAIQAYWYYQQGHRVNPHEFFTSCRKVVQTPELVVFLDTWLLPKLPSPRAVKRRMARAA